MNPATSSLIAGLASKTSLVIGVLGLGVGTAAAAGADVPLLTPTVPTIETTTSATDTGPSAVDDAESLDDVADSSNHGAAVSEFARTTELEGCAKGQAVAELASGGNHVAGDCDESDEPSATAEESEPADEVTDEATDAATDEATDEANHGQVVSEFARTTELEGCAKGQAVAELASGGNHVAKECGDDEESATDEPQPSAPAEADESAPAVEAPGSGDAPGKSGDAPGKSGDAPGKSGKNDRKGNGRNG